MATRPSPFEMCPTQNAPVSPPSRRNGLGMPEPGHEGQPVGIADLFFLSWKSLA